MLRGVWERRNGSDASSKKKRTPFTYFWNLIPLFYYPHFKTTHFQCDQSCCILISDLCPIFSRFALPVIPGSCSGDKHSLGLFLSPILERMSFLQRQCASLHRSLNQRRILIISDGIMQLTTIYAYEICLTFTPIALLLAQWLLKSLISSPPRFRSPWLHLSVYGCSFPQPPPPPPAAGRRSVWARKHFSGRSFLSGTVTWHTCNFVTVKGFQLHSGVHLSDGEGCYCPCLYALR